MIRNKLIQLLLLPISLLYGLGVEAHAFLYRTNLLKSVKFDIPVISVGNLSVGGAGKSPHIEYLIKLLQPYINTATLSRGYKRKSTGLLVVQSNNNADQVGDEPLQFKRKFEDAVVAVAESRALAIPQLLAFYPNTQAILLDDAYQHRSVTPGLNILLTEYNRPFTKDFLLPSGRLREPASAYKRADIIIVTKCPNEMTFVEKQRILDEIKPYSHQKVYFSYYQYQYPYRLANSIFSHALNFNSDVLLVSAIANTDYLVDYLKKEVKTLKIMEYTDHHYFTDNDMEDIKITFNNIKSNNKIILTTEKDATRLELHRDFIEKNNISIYVLPTEVAFHFDDKQVFDEHIKDFMLQFPG